MEVTKEQIMAAAEGGACLQRIQMRVWEYMNLPTELRDGVKMADMIYQDVKDTEEKIRGIHKGKAWGPVPPSKVPGTPIH